MKLPLKIDYITILIVLSFCFSLIVTKYYLNNYDAFNVEANGKMGSQK